jgi:hypothetical protein
MRFGYLRYFLGFLVALGLIIALIVMIFHSGGKTAKTTAPPLSSYANSSTVVRLTIDGPVTAPQNHNQIVVTVGKTKATFQQFLGYDGTVVGSKSYDNTVNSYTVLLKSLSRAGMLVGITDPKLTDSVGRCPLGQTYTFEVADGDKQIKKFWTTSCGGVKTFGGNTSLVKKLFELQIPDYNTLIQEINI